MALHELCRFIRAGTKLCVATDRSTYIYIYIYIYIYPIALRAYPATVPGLRICDMDYAGVIYRKHESTVRDKPRVRCWKSSSIICQRSMLIALCVVWFRKCNISTFQVRGMMVDVPVLKWVCGKVCLLRETSVWWRELFARSYYVCRQFGCICSQP